MATATAIQNTIQVITHYPLEGHMWLETPCRDYDHLATLPIAVEFNGRKYGRTGWNSDRNVAYYCTRQAFALGLY